MRTILLWFEKMDERLGFFEKVILSGILACDKPGFIDLECQAFIEGKSPKRRFVWFFEDIIFNLQVSTDMFIGKKRSEELWYRIGKESAIRYLLLSGKGREFHDLNLDALKNHLRGVGWSLAEDSFFDKEKLFLILKGENNGPCCDVPNKSFVSGIVSGHMTFLFGQNIEASYKEDCCSGDSEIVAGPEFKTRCVIDFEGLEPSVNYSDFNFTCRLEEDTKLSSFLDFVKFKKVDLKGKKVKFLENNILPFEVGFFGIVFSNYDRVNLKGFVRSTLVDYVEIFSRRFFYNLNLKERVVLFQNMLSAFGYGLPLLNKKNGTIEIRLKNPPFSRYGVEFQIFVINGFLNSIFDKQYVFDSELRDELSCTLCLYFSEVK